MSENEEVKQKVLEWFNKTSREGVKTKFYLKDVAKALSSEYDKQTVRKAVNDCIYEDTLMWFSTGSTNMLVLPQFHKG